MFNAEELLNLSPEQLKSYAGFLLFTAFCTILAEIAFAIFQYVIRAFSLTAIARKLHIDNPSAAYIPFGHAYIEGKICDHMLSPDLNLSRTRIHYSMLNLLYSIINGFFLAINFNDTVSFCRKMYEDGTVPISLLEDQNSILSFLSILSTVLWLVVAFFRLKTILTLYYCFNKKKGTFLVILATISPIVSAFLFLWFKNKPVVHERLEFKEPPTMQE